MIKFTYQVEIKDGDNIAWEEPEKNLFSTSSEAKDYIEKTIKQRQQELSELTEKQRKGWVEITDYRIIEVAVHDRIIFEGNVTENGDYDVYVDDKSINEKIAKYYMGNKIRVTIEVIK